MAESPAFSEIPSPCIRACELDLWRRRCVGCGRTVQEIRQWSHLTPEQKTAVLERLGLGIAAGG